MQPKPSASALEEARKPPVCNLRAVRNHSEAVSTTPAKVKKRRPSRDGKDRAKSSWRRVHASENATQLDAKPSTSLRLRPARQGQAEAKKSRRRRSREGNQTGWNPFRRIKLKLPKLPKLPSPIHTEGEKPQAR